MNSVSLQTKISLCSTSSDLQLRLHRRRHQFRVNFPRRIINVKIVCSASEQSHQPSSAKKKKSNRSANDAEKGVDPVGFLTKLGVSHKALAQFLRERCGVACLYIPNSPFSMSLSIQQYMQNSVSGIKR